MNTFRLQIKKATKYQSSEALSEDNGGGGMEVVLGTEDFGPHYTLHAELLKC